MTSIAALAILAGQAVGLEQNSAPQAGSPVRWKSGAAAPVFDRALTPRVLNGELGEHILVQLSAPATEAMRAELAKKGLRLLAPMAADVFFAAVEGNVNAAGLVRSGVVSGAAAVKPEWKLHRALLAGQTPEWTIVTQGADPEVAVYVVLHDDVPVSVSAAEVVKRQGGASISELVSVNAAVVHIPRSAIALLAQEDEVQWIEPALPFMMEMNAENRALTGVNTVNAAPYNLNGTGVKVLVFDGGSIRTTHVDLAGRVTVLDGSAISSHSTHVAGTVGGTGTAVANNRGMAPGVTFLSAALSTAAGGWLYTNPSDIETDYANAYTQGAHLATNSIGTNTAPNGFDCSWEGEYGVTDGVIDSIIRGSSAATLNNPFRVTWAAGNERGSARCGAFYRTTAPPANAKNHMCIGSVDSDNDLTSSFSSYGPADDGRMKPDFVAPGCQNGGDGGVTSCTSTSTTSYGAMCGTSMATPTVAGIVSLMLQDYRVQFPSTPDPRNSTLKVLLAQSATDRGNAGPDFQFGYGSVRAPAAIDLMRTGNFRESQVSQGGEVSYDVVVPAGAPALALTLAWDDAAGTPNSVPALVNDLDLEVYSPSGVRAFPWTLDSNNPAALAVQTQRNSRDNIEQVRVANPQAGTWKVRVRGFGVPTGPQPFSIVSSHTLSAAALFPTISIQSVTTPTLIAPGSGTTISATVQAQNDVIVPSSVVLHYRNGAGSYTDVAMSLIGGSWQASLPAFSCGASPQYYVTAQGQSGAAAESPVGGAGSPYSVPVGTLTTYFSDSMETDTGWVVGPNTATTGLWFRTNPQRTGSQPEDDTTPGAGVNCWVTDGTAGISLTTGDVDGGNTVLTSPTFSMAGAPSSATISYMRWFENNSIVNYSQAFLAQVSTDNGGVWTTLESIPAGSPVQLGWRQVTKSLATLGITGTAQMKVRFTATDTTGTASIVEAAIDDFVASSVSCTAVACYANCDNSTGSPVLTANDFQCFLDRFAASDPYANCDGSTGSPTLTPNDFQCFLNKFAAGCS